MVILTTWQLLILATLAVAVGWVACDIFWTAVVQDARAATHFTKASTRRRAAWVGVVVLVIIAAAGWLR